MQANDLHKVTIKLHAQTTPEFRLTDAIPVFHQWIQAKAIPDVMIDVADYTHVKDGPGVVLVCHEAHFGLEVVNGKAAMHYTRLRASARPTLAARLAAALRDALAACARLEQSAPFGGRITFVLDGVVIGANDRLFAGDAAAASAVQKEVTELAKAVLGEQGLEVAALHGPTAPPTYRIRVGGKAPTASAALTRAESRLASLS